MRRYLLFCLGSILAVLSAVTSSTAFSQSSETHEAARKTLTPRLEITEKEITLTVPLAHAAEEATVAHLKTELLNPHDIVRAEESSRVSLRRGQREIAIKLEKPFANVPVDELQEPSWLRFKYEVVAGDGKLIASGIEALRSPSTLPFELTAAAARMALAGHLYRVHVHTAADNGKPLSEASIHGEVSWDEDQGGQAIKAKAVTDKLGDATLEFQLPTVMHSDSASLHVEARRGFTTRSADRDLRLELPESILVDTDKDIYQPGQTLHSRILRFDAHRKAVKNALLDLRITDEEDTLVLREQLKTDDFGMARVDWAIPANVLFGNYRIRVVPAGEDDGSRSNGEYKDVRIYRYDLPNFRVNAAPDRSYYLPAQNAEINVSAEYLFGKPVPRAKVRVVEEEKREWNYRKQEWEIETGQVQTGETDRDGRFIARFDLSEQDDDLADSSYRRFRDVDMAAYVTDLSTGRTEQRRFSLRVSKEAIHVYVSDAGAQSASLPHSYYISAFYADGTPARSRVTLSWFREKETERAKHVLRTVETSKYGLAKVTDVRIPTTDDGELSLLAEARDAQGLTGRNADTIYAGDADVLDMSAAHAIYKSGDPIELTLRSTVANARVTVEALREGSVLATQHIVLHNGRGYLSFPYDEHFTDDISLVAYSLDKPAGSYSYLERTVTVLYPRDHTLGVAVHLDKDEHRPGEDAHARFTVRLPDQSAEETALGVKIVDTAVEERARTDLDFGQTGAWGWWRSPSRYRGAFGNVTREDLDHVDLTRPIPPDLDLVAEYILDGGRDDVALLSGGAENTVQQVFRESLEIQFRGLDRAITQSLDRGEGPTNMSELTVLARENGIDFAELRDPWGMPYRYELSSSGTNRIFKIISAGQDKQFATGDDIVRQSTWNYFSYYGKVLEHAAQVLMQQEGRFIRDRVTLQAEMLKQGVDFDNLRDPWNQPYEPRFQVCGVFYVIEIVSHGESKGRAHPLDTVVWTDRVDYFTRAREHLDQLLSAHLRAGGAYPSNEDEFKAVLRHAGVDLDEIHDPWGNRYYVVFRQSAQYGDRVQIKQTGLSGERSTVPVTLVRKEVRLMSPGADHQPGTMDDFQVASFSTLVSEQSAHDGYQQAPADRVNLTGYTGAITGTIVDPQGAVVAGADVQITREDSGEQFATKTNGEGVFLFKDLQPGTYTIQASAPGFKVVRTTAVPVQSMQLTEMNLVLTMGETSMTVEVMAAAPLVETTQAEVSSVASRPGTKRSADIARAAPMSTPRLRQDFPETMLWEPALVSDRHGRATLNFKFADNITTWKLTAVASTRNGELGRAEKDLRAFQPFFVEHDPPRILTQGDEIAYPVVLRNYLDRRQELRASIKPETWFTLLSPGEIPVTVEPGDSSRAVFRYRAVAAVNDGKQQVSAANAAISDAVQKPVDVHPFGRQASVIASTVMAKHETLVLQVPLDAIPGSMRARVKVYPTLLAHAVENLEAVLERPHGCGEQTISSTYPSLLVAAFYKKTPEKPAVAKKAQRYLAAGYERLLRYQDSSGGLTYWGSGNPDLSLTAYALEFLENASTLMEVDAAVAQRAELWVLDRQRPDGSWRNGWERNDQEALLTTAYVAQILATEPDTSDQPADRRHAALKKALAFLEAHRDLMDEPYVIASYALAAKAAGEQKTAADLAELLRRTAHEEGRANYWALERNTPFYGWGRTGRLESTALALRALVGAGDPDGSDKELIRQGLLFLLRNEEKDGMWYSGHTTVQVLKTLLSLVGTRNNEPAGVMRVRVNDSVATLPLPPGGTASAPIELDVTAYVKAGENRAELDTASEGMMTAQFVVESYVPWKDETPAASAKNSNTTLKFQVSYSSSSPDAGQPVECRVRAERIGYRGYGMMLGEVGLPPGADVDRESLESALRGNSFVYQYDVLPDRVILYLWPQAGGSELAFRFRPRFAMQAETAPSVLYDYYNPDASVTLKPVRFEVKQEAASK